MCVFQSFFCLARAPGVLCLMLSGISGFKEYAKQFENDAVPEYFLVVFWEEGRLTKECVSVESLEQSLPDRWLDAITRMVHCLDPRDFPLCIRRARPTLLRVLSDSRGDGLCFILRGRPSSEIFLECFHQAHQNNFGLLEVLTVVEYIVLRMSSALHEAWTEGKLLFANVSGKASSSPSESARCSGRPY